jgi:hypothetical protein
MTRAPALVEALEAAATALEAVIPANVNIGHPRWPDSTIVPCDVTLGELRKAASTAAACRAALSKAKEIPQ